MDGEYALVAPWMDNGNIIDYLRENEQANPLKLVRTTMLRFLDFLTEPRHSYRTPHAVSSISTAYSSSMVI